jgi:hypothetical protein
MNILLAALSVYALSMGDAYAYLDPGTGSIIIQGIIGAIAGGLVVGRMYWQKLKSFFCRSKAGPAPELSANRPE